MLKKPVESLDKIYNDLKTLNKSTTKISYDKYWEEVNKSIDDEQKQFESEEKKLTMTSEMLHRRFTI